MIREIWNVIIIKIIELNTYFPTEEMGFERVLSVKLVNKALEVRSTSHKDKKPVTKTEFIAITPDNQSHYTWEDMLQAFLAGAGVPIFIFREYEKQMQEKIKQQFKAQQKMKRIKAEEDAKAIKNAEIVEKAN